MKPFGKAKKIFFHITKPFGKAKKIFFGWGRKKPDPLRISKIITNIATGYPTRVARRKQRSAGVGDQQTIKNKPL